VAIVSLLVGAIINKYIPDPLLHPQDAVDLAAEAALCVGILLAGMGVLNLGRFIRFLSHPVISGFTSAAASLIGLSQLKSAFGFPNVVPQIGSHTGVEYNYEQMAWYVANWNGKTVATAETPSIFYRNHFAVKVCFYDLYHEFLLNILFHDDYFSTSQCPCYTLVYYFSYTLLNFYEFSDLLCNLHTSGNCVDNQG
jgi:hypothetical protein